MKPPDHRGKATWGERIVPLEAFRSAAASSGRALSPGERRANARRYLEREPKAVPVEGPYERIVAFGGVYSNHRALAAVLERTFAFVEEERDGARAAVRAHTVEVTVSIEVT